MAHQNNKIKGWIGTLVFHLTLLGLILYFGYITPLPLPEEQGIMINFGTDNTGMGAEAPEEEPVEQIPSQAPPTESVEQEQMTQDYEEAPVIEENKAETASQEAVEEVSTPREAPSVQEQKEEIEEREVDERSLFPGKKEESSSTSEGSGYEQGNMGDPAGEATSGAQTGKGAGEGGISYSLNGRTAQSLPVPEYNYQRSGIVVVEITVNKEGRVTEATAGVKGSTTLDEYLLRVAKKAALSAQFDRSPESPAFQKGTISYHFKLQ